MNSQSSNAYPGRYLLFEYALPTGADAVTGGLISKITYSAGLSILVSYNANKSLSALTWADGRTRSFVYENTTFPWALTGVVDENNSRFATWDYDSNGRPISSQHAGGVDFTQVGYGNSAMSAWIDSFNVAEQIIYRSFVPTNPDAITVTNAMGVEATLIHTTVLGCPLISGSSQPAGSGCSASQSASTFDINGNVSSKDDFQNNRTCYAYDAKNQETTRVEGLASTIDCAAVLPANSTLPANASKTTTSYHPDWRLPIVTTTPGSITTNIYQGQSDPFNANQVVNCTAAPSMPNGKPLPLLCKQVIQATLPSGALDSTTPNTTTSYSYDTAGRILTGTDSLNRTTSYSYDGVGQLTGVSNPDGSTLAYTYDAAHRLIGATDAKGNSVTYTLDNIGNRIKEDIKDPSGLLQRSINRSFDALNRLQQVSGAVQ